MVTIVEFRTGVDDKVAYAARWLRVAAMRGARAQVVAPMETLKVLDRMLWVDDPQDFLPHAWTQHARRTPGLERTQLWLGEGDVPPPGTSLLLNLGADVPADVSQFERVIEVVSNDADDVRAGRARWKTYLQRGLAPAHRQGDQANG